MPVPPAPSPVLRRFAAVPLFLSPEATSGPTAAATSGLTAAASGPTAAATSGLTAAAAAAGPTAAAAKTGRCPADSKRSRIFRLGFLFRLPSTTRTSNKYQNVA
jgi:hypothetical protein